MLTYENKVGGTVHNFTSSSMVFIFWGLLFTFNSMLISFSPWFILSAIFILYRGCGPLEEYYILDDFICRESGWWKRKRKVIFYEDIAEVRYHSNRLMDFFMLGTIRIFGHDGTRITLYCVKRCDWLLDGIESMRKNT